MKTSTDNRHRVLIADDQQDIRESLRLLLKNEGFETHLASSPGDVLSALEAREFDAVLMDLNYTRDVLVDLDQQAMRLDVDGNRRRGQHHR
jgi:DNA-binding NtrC family response regulator